MRTSLAVPLAAALALAPAAPAGAASDLERLEALEHEVAVLKRKLEVQQDEAATRASTAPVVGAGPDGFFLRSADSQFQLKLRAYTQLDSRWLLEPSQGGDDTFLFRRVRLNFEGTLFQNIDFRIMPDFANSTLTLFDAYVNFRYFPKAQLQVGKFKPPLGLERLQSATATMFHRARLPDAARAEPRHRGHWSAASWPRVSSPTRSARSTASATAARRTSTPTTARTSWRGSSSTRSGRSATSG